MGNPGDEMEGRVAISDLPFVSGFLVQSTGSAGMTIRGMRRSRAFLLKTQKR
jgi:hypothetical protein